MAGPETVVLSGADTTWAVLFCLTGKTLVEMVSCTLGPQTSETGTASASCPEIGGKFEVGCSPVGSPVVIASHGMCEDDNCGTGAEILALTHPWQLQS